MQHLGLSENHTLAPNPMVYYKFPSQFSYKGMLYRIPQFQRQASYQVRQMKYTKYPILSIHIYIYI